MSVRDPETIEVRDEERLDTASLEPYLREHLPETDGPFEMLQFSGGHANLTYLVRFGEHEYVLRRPPLGPVPPGAHDMRREHRVLSRLHAGYPLAPRSFVLCTDPAIIGADFHVMERRNGIAFRYDIPPPWRDRTAVLRGVGFSLVDNLALLHNVEPESVGLGDLGNPDGYLERQLHGWSERWKNALTPDVDVGEAFVRWLAGTRPQTRRITLVHNDYKLDNTLLDATDPAQTVAVLDWDMCTRGDPMMDLGYLLALWTEPGEEKDGAHGRMPTWRAGFPSRLEVVARYVERCGANVDDVQWYVLFNVFRFAVILQQIYARYVRGQTHDQRFAEFGTAVNMLMQRGYAMARGT